MNNFQPFVQCVCPSCCKNIYLGQCSIVSGVTSGKVLKRASKSPFARMNVESLDGPRYTLELAHRQCYECGYLLPPNIENVPSITLAVVGDTFSGKSHYIAAFIHQLQTQWLGSNSGFVQFTCLTPDVERYYIQNYFNPLFVAKQALPATAQATKSTADPLIYKLVVSQTSRHPATTVNLMIYDMAGETFENQARLVEVGRFALTTNAFIFVTDPGVMPPVYTQLPVQLQNDLRKFFNYAQGRRISTRLSDILSMFSSYRREPEGSSLPNIPIAVMLSKADLLQHIYGPNSCKFMRNPYYTGELDLQDIKDVDEEIQSFLIAYQQGDILAATRRYKRVKFFATSATGEPPDAISNTFSNVEPCRCLDPVLWILHEMGVVRARR